jgi:hypothetical protein
MKYISDYNDAFLSKISKDKVWNDSRPAVYPPQSKVNKYFIFFEKRREYVPSSNKKRFGW